MTLVLPARDGKVDEHRLTLETVGDHHRDFRFVCSCGKVGEWRRSRDVARLDFHEHASRIERP